MGRMAKGKVKWFDSKKGYGFLHVPAERKDIFVHYSDISQEGFKNLTEDQVVEFEIVSCEKGEKAQNVKVIS